MSETTSDTMITVVGSDEAARQGWDLLTDPPGRIPSGGSQSDVFSTAGGAVSTGFWRREPDTWSFERPYDEVALIMEGDADIVTGDGTTLTVGPGDVLVTPKGSSGTWVIRETITKFWVIYDG